jgi:hypothetical protein
MRAREFVENGPQFPDILKTVLRKDTPPQQTNQNANAVPQPPVASTGTQNPQKYSAVSAGTPTPQNGVPTLPTTAQSAQGQTTGSTPNQPNSSGQSVQDLSKIQSSDVEKLKGKTFKVSGITNGEFTVDGSITTPDGPGIKLYPNKQGPMGGVPIEVSLKDLAKPRP